MVKSYDVLIDGQPYIFDAEGLVLGDALTEPAPPRQLGSAVIENIATGIGPKLSRGNGYYDIHRLIPSVEGQLIHVPKVSVGAQHVLGGLSEYTPGIKHHPFAQAGAQYIAFGKAIYSITLADVVALTYTNVTGSDPTAAPISNANARYTGGGFVWRNRIYFGIENALNGDCVGYAYVDAATPTAAIILSDAAGKGFSYGAASRGRVFVARNKGAPDGIQLKWSSDMANDYSAAGHTQYGSTGTFVYGIENRPRVTWVEMLGSAVLFFLANGGVLASDEAGFIGIAGGRAQASAAEDNFQGFGAVPYLDGMAYRVNYGGPHHINPVTLLTKSMSPGNVQDVPLDVNDVTIRCMTSVGEHLLMAGDKYLYDIVWTGAQPVVHKIMDLSLIASAGFVPGDMTYQGGLLVITMVNTATSRFQQIQLEPIPSINKSILTPGGAVVGWVEPGILVGPARAASMTKLWLQVRGSHYTRVNAASTLSFSTALVDETKAVTIAGISAPGPWAAAITASPQLNRLGRTLSFRLNVNSAGHTGFDERVYMPIVADFLWAPSNTDMLTLTLKATSEQLGRAGGLLRSRSARQVVDALIAKQYTVITVVFSDGSPSPATWTMFVEGVEAARTVEAESGTAADAYVVKMACRRLS